METSTQQGALLELQAWLEAAEILLEEHRSRINQTSSTNTDLSQLLKYCKVGKDLMMDSYKRSA